LRPNTEGAGNEKNTLIAIDPDYDLPELIAPYQPLKMAAVHFPVDPRLSFLEANDLLSELRPGRLVTSPLYTTPATRSGSTEYGGTAADGGRLTKENAILFDPARYVAQFWLNLFTRGCN
jgi:hypothetical protein